MPEPGSYTLEEAATIFRVISNFLLTKPKLLEHVGILRVGGKADDVKIMTEQVLKGEPLDAKADFNTYTSAMKKVLSANNVYLKPDNPLTQGFRDAMEQLEKNNPEGAVGNFYRFVESLANSDKHENQLASEIIYRYIHLGKKIAAQSKMNLMDAENVAIILTPLFTNNMQCMKEASDPSLLISLTPKINTLMTAILKSDKFSMKFEEAFPLVMIEEYKKRTAERSEIGKGKQELKEIQSAYKVITKSVKGKLKHLENEKADLLRSLDAKEKIFKQGGMTKTAYNQYKEVIEGKVKSLENDIAFFKESKMRPAESLKKFKEDLSERGRKINPVTPTSPKRSTSAILIAHTRLKEQPKSPKEEPGPNKPTNKKSKRNN